MGTARASVALLDALLADRGFALRAVWSPPRRDAARREVVSLLDEVGFAPQPDARSSTVRLTRCPLLEAAHKHPDVVCGVHLGLARGALEEYGADPDGTELLPFAEPGACRLHLMRRS